MSLGAARLWWLHRESKSLAPDGSPCIATTRGLLRRRAIEAGTFRYIGKEVDRRVQDDTAVFSDIRPLEYGLQGRPIQTGHIPLEERNRILHVKQMIEELGIKESTRRTRLDRNTIRRILRGKRVHPKTWSKMLQLIPR